VDRVLRQKVKDLAAALAAHRGEAGLLVMLILSLAVTLFHDRLLTETLDLTAPKLGATRYAYGDVESGGNSVTRPDPHRRNAWECRLDAGFDYPYCGYELLFDAKNFARGIDLSRFQSLTLRMRYAGPARRLSVYIKNHDPRYSVPGQMRTNKYNRLDLDGSPGQIVARLKLRDFSVSEWWLTTNHMAPALAGPQFDNVVSFAIQTGPDAPLGRYRFAIEGVTLKRSILSREQLYLVLLAIWGVIILLSLALRVLSQKREWKRKLAVGREVEEALRRSHDRAHHILDSVPQMIWEADPQGRCTYQSRQWYEFTGSDRDVTAEESWLRCVHPKDLPAVRRKWRASLASGAALEAECRLRFHNGDYRWCLARAVPHRDDDGELVGWYGTCTDVHAHILAQQALIESEALNRSIFEISPDCIAIMDLDGRILDANAAGKSSNRLRDRFGSRRVAAGGRREGSRLALAEAQAGRVGRFSHKERGSSGKWWDVLIAPLRDGEGKPTKLVSIARDITQQKQAEERAYWVANHDSLTGLPNRTLMQETLERAVEQAVTGPSFSLLLLDVDDFKRVNDMFGHDGGDALLCAFAARLQACLRPEDHVFRLGGDEFALLLTGTSRHEEIDAFAERMFENLAEPCIHAGRMLDLRASVGAAIWSEHGRNRSELMKNADIALYAAKAAGRKTLKLFAPAMRDEVQRRASMLSLARSALQDDRILPFYQPKVNLRTGEIVGFEALLRWRQPGRGIQLPCTIAAAFEDPALAAEISDRIIDGVIADVRRWQEAKLGFGHVAVNAAAAEFRRGDFAERLLARLGAAGLPTTALQVEVTESVFVGRGAECVERALKRLSHAGMQIALDDFGTGYASLSHLQQFPVDTIKIDQSFVQGLGTSGGNQAIIDAVLSLGRSLGITVVAEGIETAAQEQALLRLRCQYGQGYLYGRAVPAAEVAALLARPDIREHGAAAA
jgi:diguanylate cyclase (GGDEF)-like protein/PAS domain S-box-containing protein